MRRRLKKRLENQLSGKKRNFRKIYSHPAEKNRETEMNSELKEYIAEKL